MSEIYQFKINRADARVTQEGLCVRLYCPKKPTYTADRLQENMEFGVTVFRQLIDEGYSSLASDRVPLNSVSGGALYLFNDGKIACHRRDRYAPTHRLLHGTCSGFSHQREEIYSAASLHAVGLRESVEECLFITRESPQQLIVPREAQELTLQTAKNLGIHLEHMVADFGVLPCTDVLEVYDEEENFLFTTRALVDFLYETQTAINVSTIRTLPFSSKEVLPLDAEGMMKNGRFIHFNRESYIIGLDELMNKEFGDALENPEVHQVRVIDGEPHFYSPTYHSPYLGPGAIEVTHPHIWAPNNLLTRALDALGVESYKGKWKEIELKKETYRLQGRSLISPRFLGRGEGKFVSRTSSPSFPEA